MNDVPEISIVSPVYGSPELIPQLVSALHQSLQELGKPYEILLVFDCSPDDGWERICEACEEDARVKGIQLSRNFGQHYAITAGLTEVTGEWIVVMDCDLQDRPEEIINLYHKAQEGYDAVFAQRLARQDSISKRLLSKAFYWVFSYLTGSKQDATVANFGIYRRCVIEAILSMKDTLRYFPTMSQWVGFKKTYLPVSHGARESGESTYTWRSLFKLASENMIAFSDKPLQLTVRLGMTMCVVTVAVGLLYLFRYLFGSITVTGFASLILSIWFLAGVVIFLLGVLGTYLGRIFDQTKNRPQFIVRERINFDEN